MPLYFFNFSRAPTTEHDPFKNEGLELVDNEAAWEEATTACGEKLREIGRSDLETVGRWKLRTATAEQYFP